ncbi:MAG: sodium:solute symporter family protein [Vicinamibacterales bacterium]|jgi:SSS family transporter|nr:Na+:solute symporter [Acidobacteriota bacterium]MDP6371538.1 sodium:solute symporter family protein [Vicinamibacterales bacterium]MQG59593.1 sodium:solute symporter family protein [SAR202 cluster bacterium]MDP6609994.1 sodium:solute symporter family protein [Vicinamibacterales bacterium]MQG67972.1 sodium:solute symporter family protein [SAR202 cluster bacterium]|tara:strand:- start:23902 stop:25332 length:1431 start_codon:yes stop_codon:yes gene_type:complete
MLVERALVGLYLAGCITIGIIASRRALSSRDEYWVAGRRVGTVVNAMALMASLASGGSIIGVMGLAYAQGIPATLALFTGSVVGFSIAAFLVAGQLRRFGKYTITDFLTFRYPHKIVAYLVPIFIVVAFLIYIVAQLKAAGITAVVLLGIPYETALVLACVVFIAYVSIGGMTAITWTDVVQGSLMLVIVVGAAVFVMLREGSPATLLVQATSSYPELGQVTQHPVSMYLGNFIIWATAIPVIPHIVMRVLSAKDPVAAKLSLNIAMLAFGVLILTAVFTLVPLGKTMFPGLTDPDQVFLNIMAEQFPPVVRGAAVAAVLAAVMSTTDALLLACSSAIAHDILGGVVGRLSSRGQSAVRIGSAWGIGIVAMFLALSPPELITEFYTAGVGLLSASLFVPTVFGLWWSKANLTGGIAALVVGAAIYVVVLLGVVPIGYAPIVIALPASAIAMMVGGILGAAETEAMLHRVGALHGGE